jgi:signal transduction histidine kinase
MAARSPVPATIAVTGDPHGLSDELRATAWFVCSEALANVARHSEATEARIALAIGAGALRIEVRDDGRGGATPERGLRGLADRVEASGGTLAITSPPGGPTVISARLPVV